MLIGTVFSVPQLWRVWRSGRPVAIAIARWFLLAYGLGLYATLPALFRRLSTCPDGVLSPWWNLFLGYGWIDQLPLPSIVLGELAIAGLFGLQYVIILLAIRRACRCLTPPC